MKPPTRNELAAEVEKLSGSLQQVSLTILTQAKIPQIPGFVCSFIRYQATQGFRIARALRQDHVDDVDLIAHATRGLFESLLLYWHLMKDGGRSFMATMLREVSADHLDTLKATKASFEPSLLPPSLDQDILELERQNVKRTPSVRSLAEETGAETEYKAVYSLYSKYTHPSLYQIAGDHREVFSNGACVFFGMKAVQYLRRILHESTRIQEVVVAHNNQAEPADRPNEDSAGAPSS